jgi:hypothetical protein
MKMTVKDAVCSSQFQISRPVVSAVSTGYNGVKQGRLQQPVSRDIKGTGSVLFLLPFSFSETSRVYIHHQAQGLTAENHNGSE